MRRLAKESLSCLAAALILLISANTGSSSDQIPGKPQDHPIALTGGTIHTVSGATIESGTILFEEGKITKIGRNVDLPPGTEAIDVSGLHVYPGLIATYTNIGLVEINSIRATRDFAEIGEVNPNVRAEVAINPDSEIIPVTRANGVTLALSIPTGGVISGQSAMIMLDGWTWEDMTLKSSVGMHVTWPYMGISTSPWVRMSPKEQEERRDKQINQIKDTFSAARAYLKAKEAEGKSGIPDHDADLRLEALIPVLKGDVPVIVRANEIRQIQAAVDWASAENLKMVLLGGGDAWRVTNLLKEKEIPVIIEAVHETPMRRWEPYDTPFRTAKRLLDAGVQFCIAGSGTSYNQRNLPYHAAMAAAYGLPKEEALKAITLYPAQILGVADQVGSLETGKDATLIVANGDPLEITTNVVMEFMQGRKVDLSSRHTELYAKYQQKYRQLGLIGEKIAKK